MRPGVTACLADVASVIMWPQTKPTWLRIRQTLALPIYTISLILDFACAALAHLAAWIAGDDWPIAGFVEPAGNANAAGESAGKALTTAGAELMAQSWRAHYDALPHGRGRSNLNGRAIRRIRLWRGDKIGQESCQRGSA